MTILALFDTIIRPGDGMDGDMRVMQWLASEGPRFRGMLERLRGKVELGVQVIWDQRLVGKTIAQGDDAIRARSSQKRVVTKLSWLKV